MGGSGSASPPTTANGRALARPFAVGLGAFSGEVQRLDDALSTCRSKAWIGLEQSGLGQTGLFSKI